MAACEASCTVSCLQSHLSASISTRARTASFPCDTHAALFPFLCLPRRLHPSVWMQRLEQEEDLTSEHFDLLLFDQHEEVCACAAAADPHQQNMPSRPASRDLHQQNMPSRPTSRDPHQQNMLSRPTSPASVESLPVSCRQHTRVQSLSSVGLPAMPLEVKGRGGREARPWSPVVECLGPPHWPNKMRCDTSTPHFMAASRRSPIPADGVHKICTHTAIIAAAERGHSATLGSDEALPVYENIRERSSSAFSLRVRARVRKGFEREFEE